MIPFSKIIVTGADGWLGFSLITELVSKAQEKKSEFYSAKIVVLVQSGLLTAKFNEIGVEVIVGDLRNENDLDRLLKDAENSLVFNLAGIIHPDLFSQRAFNEINHLAMVSFAAKCVDYRVKKFVAMSSNSPCGYSKDTSLKFDEDSPYSPYMGYGRSKMEMEQKVLSIANTTNSTNFSIIRSPWFYGPHQPARQTEFFSLIKNGLFPLIGGGESMRSMGYIDNLIQGLILASSYYDSTGEIFWIADESPYSMKEIVMTVKTLLADEFEFKVVERQIFLPAVISDFARFADCASQACGLYIQKVHVLSEMNQTIACDITKAKKVLGYNPKVDLEEGMRRSIKWCLANNRVI